MVSPLKKPFGDKRNAKMISEIISNSIVAVCLDIGPIVYPIRVFGPMLLGGRLSHH